MSVQQCESILSDQVLMNIVTQDPVGIVHRPTYFAALCVCGCVCTLGCACMCVC